MKKRCKFILCFLVCLGMLMGMLPTTAYADNENNYVSNVSLTEENNSVFGKGIITGSAELDAEKCYNPTTKENKGYDDSYSNNIIRSHDNITYNVKSEFSIDKTTTHTLVYEVTLPNDPEITIDDASNDVTVTSVVSGDNKIYTCKYQLDYYKGWQ